MFILGVVTKFVSLFFIFFAYKTYKLPTASSKSTINEQQKKTDSSPNDNNRSRCNSVNVSPRTDIDDVEAGALGAGAYRNKAYSASKEELGVEELDTIEMVEEKPKIEGGVKETGLGKKRVMLMKTGVSLW